MDVEKEYINMDEVIIVVDIQKSYTQLWEQMTSLLKLYRIDLPNMANTMIKTMVLCK